MRGFIVRFRIGAVLLQIGLLLGSGAVAAHARNIRVGTYNVRVGVGSPGSTEYNAVYAVLERINGDVMAFQELNTSDLVNWETMASALGYPYTVTSDTTGLSGDLRTGYMSRWPILEYFSVLSPDDANDVSRPPFRVVVDVPGTLRPLVLWTLHHKAFSDDKNEFRRAVEARRCTDDITSYLQSHPLHTEYVVLGDFNDDVGQAANQVSSFSYLPSGLPSSFDLGSDVSFPVSYRTFPRDAYASLTPAMTMLAAYHEDSSAQNTFITYGRIDYIFTSADLWNSVEGSPRAEVYNADRDDGIGGLPKAGAALPAGTTSSASDHYPVFSDLAMEDEDVIGPDGVGKAWRLAHFGHVDPQASDLSRAGDDPDMDGMDNQTEFIADTDPGRPDSRFVVQRVDLQSGSTDLDFHTSTGRVYTVQYTDDLVDPVTWSDASDHAGRFGTGGTETYRDDGSGTAPDPGAADRRTYRIKVQLPN